jgi:hypothetical protein
MEISQQPPNRKRPRRSVSDLTPKEKSKLTDAIDFLVEDVEEVTEEDKETLNRIRQRVTGAEVRIRRHIFLFLLGFWFNGLNFVPAQIVFSSDEERSWHARDQGSQWDWSAFHGRLGGSATEPNSGSIVAFAVLREDVPIANQENTCYPSKHAIGSEISFEHLWLQ